MKRPRGRMENIMENLPRSIKPQVYKLGWKGRVFYRLGLHAHDARAMFAREVKIKPEEIEILDGGKKQ
ncbi:MAG: hypothetical protein A2Y92_04015 [Chloroflexi bacterium RBG_13_57_8]|nr:MAG: hypothetical protein A2Y92_04015 [Chloroflexi bacterium RBG_13_57_8]